MHFRRAGKIAKSDYQLRHVPPSAWNNSAPTKLIVMKLDISAIFENLSKEIKFYKNLTKTTGTLHKDVSTFMAISR
jgi:hypothetical protein